MFTRERAVELAKTLGRAAITILARIAFWGTAGALASTIAFFVLLLAGAYEHPWPPWRYLVWLLLPVHFLAAAIAMGHAGLVRGIGRVVLDVAMDRGLVPYAIDRILDRMADLLSKSEALSGAYAAADVRLQTIPLQRFEDMLKRAIDGFVGSDDLEGDARGLSRRILRSIKRFLSARIEKYLLAMVRAEPGGISLARVRELAAERAAEAIRDAILGMMSKQTLLMAGLCTVLLMLPPAVIVLSQRL
jgi:hypothetical protein